MTTRIASARYENEGELMAERIVQAGQSRVWNACVEPDEWKQWWGGGSVFKILIKADLRNGGEYLYCTQSPTGKNYWYKGRIVDLCPPERLVLTDSLSKGRPAPAAGGSWTGNYALESLVSLTLEGLDAGKTLFTVRYRGLRPDELGYSRSVWSKLLCRLQDYLTATAPAGDCPAPHGTSAPV